MTKPFALEPWQVPEFPESNQWICHLRWCVAVMDHDDPDLGFIASLLSHAGKGGLTDKQAKYATRVVDRVRALWTAEHLACQVEPPAGSLADVAPGGTA